MNIAIIGGGVSGVSILSHMVHHTDYNRDISIDLYDGSGMMGQGQAYQDDSSDLLINIPAEEMSMPNHMDYESWLEANSYPAEGYTSRQLFGRYVSEHLEDIAARYGNVHLIYKHVDDLRYDSESEIFTLVSDGDEGHYDHVFLAIGQLRYSDPYDLEGMEGFLHDPYPVEKIVEKYATGRTGIIGAGLSAIDCIRYLLMEREEDEVHAFSRSGEMPSVRGSRVDIELQYFTYENLSAMTHNDEISLAEIKDLFLREMDYHDVGVSLFHRRTGDTVKDLKYDIEHPHEVGRLQHLITSTNPVFSDFYQYLPRTDKMEFLDRYHPFIDENHSPMPREVAESLVDWVESGRLHIIDGTESIEKEGAFIVHTEEGEHYAVDTLINATGPVKDVRESGTGIIGRLLDHMLIGPSEFGGVMVDEKRCAISPKIGTIEKLHVIGALTIGADYLSNSVQLLSRNAEKMVEHFYMDMK